ncbi:glycoside hydrolase [Neoconidiobolus thromboides FSU 785]|nr:glycoside hydrolase [Neoconidiobolus thromboides FSU 785]
MSLHPDIQFSNIKKDNDEINRDEETPNLDSMGDELNSEEPVSFGTIPIKEESPVLISIDSEGVPQDLLEALVEIAIYCPHKNIYIHGIKFFEDKKDMNNRFETEFKLTFIEHESLEIGDLEVSCEFKKYKYFEVDIRYRRKIEAFKALGRILTIAFQTRTFTSGKLDWNYILRMLQFKEMAQFEDFCLMIDCSRNAVPTVSFVKAFLRYGALMGYTMLQLYTEDTYKIQGQAFFGFCRGGYTFEELKTIDDYAFHLGIEVVACIQTLGHLGQMLQWPENFKFKDTSEVILAGSEESYEQLEVMIKAATAPLRSKNIHIGMDEASGLGEGEYRRKFPMQDPSTIFINHLDRLREICDKLELKPMIWSDMLFCLSSNSVSLDGYYADCEPIKLSNNASKLNDLDLVYWDYYHTDFTYFRQKIDKHIELGQKNIWVAGGAWTWTRFWCSMPFSIRQTYISMKASKSSGSNVNKYMLTLWGDDGAECDYFSALPVMAYASLQAYTSETNIDTSLLRSYFAAICGGEFDAWYEASQLDELPFFLPSSDLDTLQPVTQGVGLPPNTSKHLLWEDPLYSIFSATYSELPLTEHYTKLYEYLNQKITEKSKLYPLNHRLMLPAYLAKVLSLKVDIRSNLVERYRICKNNNLESYFKGRLKDFSKDQLEQLRESIIQLWQYHRSMWHSSNKPFGWEVLEGRYGTLMTRFNTLSSRVTDYCDYGEKIKNVLEGAKVESYTVELVPDDNNALNSEPDVPIEELSSIILKESTDQFASTANKHDFANIYSQESNLQQSKIQPIQQFGVWPIHAFDELGSYDQSINTIPEFEIDIPSPYVLEAELMLINYYRATTVSRLG